MRREVRRRTLLRSAALAPIGGLLTACGGLARTAGLGDFVRVAVSWSAAELAAFADVLDRRMAGGYELIPLGDDIGAALGARTTGGPDVVAVPQVGHVTANLDQLAPLPDGVWQDDYRKIWPAASVGGRHYALPFKLAHTSTVWYRTDLFDRHRLLPPTTWDGWLDLNARLSKLGIAPLALGGADGWILAQFFENILLRSFPATFDALTEDHDADLWTSDDVLSSFRMAATMWGGAGTLTGGPERALVQQFPDAVLEMCRYGRAAMVAAPDFAESVIRRFAPDPRRFDTFTFPSRNGADTPYAISSDLLVLTNPASEQAIEMIRHLASPAAPVPWIRGIGGFIAANPDTGTGYYSPTLRRLSAELRGDHDTSFGLADRLGRLGGGEGLQRVLQNLLRAVAAGTSPDRAAEDACRAMVDAEHRTR
jgi:alpha-glucoside transport system substrate-binding protein